MAQVVTSCTATDTGSARSPDGWRGATVPPVWTRYTDLVVERGEGSWIETIDGERYLDYTCGSRSPTPATPIRGSLPRSPSRRARSSTPSRTSSTTSPGWSCTSGCRAPSRAWNAERPGSSCRTRGRRRSRRPSSSPSTPRDDRESSPSAVASTVAPTAPCRSPARASSTAATTSRCWPGVHFAAFPYALRNPTGSSEAATAFSLATLEELFATVIYRRTWPRSSWSRSWARAATWCPRTTSCPRCARSPTATASCSSSTRCRPASAAPATCGPARSGVRPDILVMAKGIASGMPLSGIMARRDLLDRVQPGLPRRHLWRQRRRLRRGAGHAGRDRRRGPAGERRRQGDRLLSNLRRIAGEHATVAEVRGRGLMVGIEFADRESLAPRPDLAKDHPGGVRAQAAAARAAPTDRWCASSRPLSPTTPRSIRPSAPSRSRWPSAPEPRAGLARRGSPSRTR